jgi:hypothetical protein
MNPVKILLVCVLCGACVTCANKDTRENSHKVYQRTYNDAVAEGLNHESAQNRALLTQMENNQKPIDAKEKFAGDLVGGLFEGLFKGILGLDNDSDDDFFQ